MYSENDILTTEELCALGLGSFGSGVRIHRTALFFGARDISLGSHVRIDAYCVLSAGLRGIRIGDFVHLGTGVSIQGAGRVEIEDFCGLSAKVSVFSSSDDYSGGAMTNPMIPPQLRNVTSAPVVLRKHAVVGANTVIMPGVTIEVGAAVGALSFVNKNVPAFTVVSGNPMRKVGTRDRSVLDKEQDFRAGVMVNERRFVS